MSDLTQKVFRSSRQRGLSHEDSVNRVYQAGALASVRPKHLSKIEIAAGHAVYVNCMIAGLQPDEALDDVFLAGYSAAQQGAFGELEAAV